MTAALYDELVAAALAKAPPAMPPALANAIATVPAGVPFDLSLADAFYDAILSDYPSLNTSSFEYLGPDDRGAATDLLAWLVGEIASFPSSTGPTDPHTISLVAAAATLDKGPGLWAALAGQILAVRSPILGNLASLACMIKSSVAPSAPLAHAAQSDLSGYLAADAAGEWESVGEFLDLYSDQFHPPWVVTTAARILSQLSPRLLAAAGDRQATAVDAWCFAFGLDAGALAALAKAASVDRMRFVALWILSAPRKMNLTAAHRSDIVEALVAAGQSSSWPHWCAAFGAYPARRPAMVEVIGSALAHLPAKAGATFIAAARLDTDELTCAALSACFETFAAEAPKKLRKEIWAKSHARWNNWNYGDTSMLLGSRSSSFDAAVAGYFVDVLTDAQLHTETGRLEQAIRDIDLEWQRTIGAAKSARNHLKARLSIAQRARTVREGQTHKPLPNAAGSSAMLGSTYHELKWKR
ncbi:hypothetical protein [Sphingopyxis sp. 22461]|uniref:hypothetical protein n=1 Tax=Sphingopyxis sp. 22461 TaxID=3453923 RepID=UPI003F83AF0A